jgi:hypothetical protein
MERNVSNINLNAGGVLGALLFGAAVGLIVFGTDRSGAHPTRYRLVIGGVIAGAFAGNYLWGLLFKKANPENDLSDRGRRRPRVDGDEPN